jgi:TetR/AcrR family transcriptional regulator
MTDDLAEKTRAREGDEARGAASRESLLQAARTAFAERGLEGARVDDIAKRAGVNKQLVYHYFGSKEGLYTAALEEVYNEIRQREQALDLSRFPAEEAVRRLIEFSFDYLAENPDFVALVTDENVHGARHLNDSGKALRVNRPIIDLLEATLERGASEGVFRRGLDPFHVYLSIAGASFFYFSNKHTLGRIFGRSLDTADAIAERRAHLVDFILNAIRTR